MARQIKVNGASGGHRLQTDPGERSRPAVSDGGWVASGWRPVLAGHSSSGPGTWRGRKRRRPGLVLGLIFAACTPTRTPVRGTCPARTGHQPRPEKCALRSAQPARRPHFRCPVEFAGRTPSDKHRTAEDSSYRPPLRAQSSLSGGPGPSQQPKRTSNHKSLSRNAVARNRVTIRICAQAGSWSSP